MTKEEWDRAFLRVLPVASLGLGILSATMGILVAQRSSTLERRVYSQDGAYLVDVRYGQWHDLRDFVQPDNPDVLAVYSQYGPDYWSLYDFVCRNIDYSRDLGGEFWQIPSETLKGTGDCEDSAILLTSLIRAGGAPNCYVALGSLEGLGHAWCEHNGQVLETTFTSARPIQNPEVYRSLVIFNDENVLELQPNGLAEIFELRRNEELKLSLMAEAVGG